VADWRIAEVGANKIKKSGSAAPVLKLVENPDILARIGQSKSRRPSIVVGFAAETENVIPNAQAKLAKKNCDLVVANDVGEGSGVFGGNKNLVHLISKDGVESWPSMDKSEVAARLIAQIAATGGPKE
jgi:phosphopantothenoylcysteine decarboxylase / phosphopantothenate---cysteine ligase